MSFSTNAVGPFGVLKRDNSAHFEPILTQCSPFRHMYVWEPVVTRFGPWKIPKCLENGPFWDQIRVKNGSGTCFSKSDPEPFELHKQVKRAHVELVWSHFGPSKVPESLENGPFCDQKLVKLGSKMSFSTNDVGPYGVLKRGNSTPFEPILTQCSPLRHMYAPSCTLRTYLRAILWSHLDLGRGV